MKNLVIVESPAKAKTIKKYLGKGYDVVASMGHVRDLPEKRLSVDIKKDFAPKYAIIKGKEKIVEELKEKAEKSDNIYLATDPDREGEAISWHLAYILGLDLDKKNRITFNEITKSGIESGIKSPREVDIDLVNAQQARRILDRLVGYKLSPFLSQKIHKGLSAGRVQSVALRIIVDREDEIRKFVPKEYWSIDAKFLPKGSSKQFSASFYGNEKGKIEVNNQEEANQLLSDLENATYEVKKIKKSKRRKSPAPPFITSTLQQDSLRKLGFTPKKTMKIAQELYEGVEIQEMGAVGLITYMRTDSLRVSEDAVNASREYINERWGKKYLPENPRKFKTKSNAQDGHEAIRPTMPKMNPEKLENSLSRDQYRLYKLIWERFTASQMAICLQDTTQVDIIAITPSEKSDNYIFKASGYTVAFDGFTVLYTESKDTDQEKAKALPELTEKMPVRLKSLEPNQHFTEPPPRYTQASLIKALEEDGIGRPSTYASIISTILSRDYVKQENKSLKPTELGEVVTNLMKERFSKIVNLKFTAQMESDLDSIEEGKNDWVETLKNFYGDFSATLDKAKKDMEGVKITLEEDKTDEICDKCGKPMVVKYGRFGKFIACSGYPECTNIKKIVNKIGVKCPKCDGDVIKRTTKRKRIFYGCSKYPECDFVSWDEPLNEKCPKCGKGLFKKNTKNPKIYCANKECGYEKAGDNEKES
ncbi:MAG: type I DNA topoisomerase [Clostridia bacterium]|nr:type I DNA topoisomerase [Clostridia bacterium]